MQQRTATWNRVRGVWEKNQVSLLCGHLVPFLETWPTSGMTRAGAVYVLPTWVPLTDDSESLSLPTPRASRGASGTETMYKLGGERNDENRPQGQVLLKTPTSQLAVNGGSQHPDKRKAGGHGPTLADEVEHLLPTPAAMNPNDGESVETWEARRVATKERVNNGNGFGTPLASAVKLLPTQKASDAMMGTPSTTGRPVEMATLLSTPAMLLAGHLEHRRTGATTHPPFDVGKQPPAA